MNFLSALDDENPSALSCWVGVGSYLGNISFRSIALLINTRMIYVDTDNSFRGVLKEISPSLDLDPSHLFRRIGRILSKPRPLDRSPRPVIFRTPNQVTT